MPTHRELLDVLHQVQAAWLRDAIKATKPEGHYALRAVEDVVLRQAAEDDREATEGNAESQRLGMSAGELSGLEAGRESNG